MKKLIGKDVGSFVFTPVSRSINISGINTFTQEQLLLITHATSGSILYNFADPATVFGTTVSASTITLAYDTTAMSGSDPLLVYIDVTDGDPIDYNLGAQKVLNQTPEWARYTDVESLLSVAQKFTSSFQDLGPEIDCSGYSNIGLWLKNTPQSSSGLLYKALAKHTYGGTEEYDLPIQIVSSNKIDITPEVNQLNNGNSLYVLKVQTDNIVPYIQFQVAATVTGSLVGTVDTAYVTKGK